MTSDEPTTNALPAYLASLGVDATLVRTDREIPTVDLAAAALGVPPAAIVKSIVFEHKLDPTRVCLAIVPGDARVSRQKVSEALGVRQLKLASPETVLKATGYRAGGVPPVCHLGPVSVALDRRVFEHSVVFGGGGDEWHMLRITPHDIQRLTGAVVADLVEDAEPR
jgi:prolyl-tRNA editing enzyme YbaK/EbsC (Cys-tRNA(Pro) deacylase)